MFWAMWCFMLACNLIAPVFMLLFGRRFQKNPPRERNSWYGYRTSRSLKSQDAWDFAQRYMGEVWYKVGGVLALFAAAGQLLTALAPDVGAMCMWSTPVTAVELVVMALSIIPVERALKRSFDENGIRRQG